MSCNACPAVTHSSSADAQISNLSRISNPSRKHLSEEDTCAQHRCGMNDAASKPANFRCQQRHDSFCFVLRCAQVGVLVKVTCVTGHKPRRLALPAQQANNGGVHAHVCVCGCYPRASVRYDAVSTLLFLPPSLSGIAASSSALSHRSHEVSKECVPMLLTCAERASAVTR